MADAISRKWVCSRGYSRLFEKGMLPETKAVSSSTALLTPLTCSLFHSLARPACAGIQQN
eukprot:2132122-Rhodomonas_salina.1